jgi:hypothetical protein
LTFDEHFCANTGSHRQRCAIRPLVHWLIKKTSDEKRGNLKMQRGSSKRHPMKKEATPKMQRGSSKRAPMKKEATPRKKGEALLKIASRRGTIVRRWH